MKLEDENFEEEFLKWLDSKSEEELVKDLKKYERKVEIKCDKCGSDYEENYYKYNGYIFCFDCLIQELENTKGMNVVKTTHYYNDDWGELGTDDDISEVIQNICEDYDVEEIKS